MLLTCDHMLEEVVLVLLVFTYPLSHVVFCQAWGEATEVLEVGPFFGYQF